MAAGIRLSKKCLQFSCASQEIGLVSIGSGLFGENLLNQPA
jgi:hypothetical protein